MVGGGFERLGGFFSALWDFNHNVELVAVAEFVADLAGLAPFRVAIAEEVGEVGLGAQAVHIAGEENSEDKRD